MNDDLLRMFAELNPVQDPDRLVGLDAPDLPADPVLRTLLERARTNGGRLKAARFAATPNADGWEELIERSGAELADPVVAVPRVPRGADMSPTRLRPTRSQPGRFGGLTWAAGFVAIVAVAATYLAASNTGDQATDVQPPPTTVAPDDGTLTDLEVIHAGVEALYSGDAEQAVELFRIEDDDAEAQRANDDLIRQEAAFQAAINGRLTLNCTEEPSPVERGAVVTGDDGRLRRLDVAAGAAVFTCNVPYHNALTDAVGYVDSPGDFTYVVVQDGAITQFGPWQKLVQGFTHEFPWHNFVKIGLFLKQEVEGSEGCTNIYQPRDWDVERTPGCARLIMDHLDEWAAWYRTNG